MKNSNFQNQARRFALPIALIFSCIFSFSAQDEKTVGMHCNHPEMKNRQIGASCKQGHSCKSWSLTTHKVNGVIFDVRTDCGGSPLYNFAIWNKVRYVVYKKTGMQGTYEKYQKVDDFTCNKNQKVEIFNGYFTNNTKFSIFMFEQDPATVYNTVYYLSGAYYLTPGTLLPQPHTNRISDTWMFTTLNHQGTKCNSNGK